MQLRLVSHFLFSANRRPVNHQFQSLRYSSKQQIQQKCISLIYEKNGDPASVLNIMETTLPEPKKDQLLVKMLASPINPADINMIQGVYAVKPELPAIGGNEGVGEVIQVGSKVRDFSVGDLVVPSRPGLGTWRTHAVCASEDLACIPKNLSLAHAATLTVNPCTAYRMLKDFGTLEEGDIVIQNAANSAVGKAVIQIASMLKLRTINVVRERPDIETLTSSLTSLGATHVITDAFVRSPDMKELMAGLPKAKLGLNAVGGKNGAELMKFMDFGSTLVTYGGMSKQPLLVPAGQLIFNNIKIEGFWMTRWTDANRGGPLQKEMFKWLTDLMIEGKFQPPEHEFSGLSDFCETIKKAMEPYSNKKQIFQFDSQ